MSNPNTHRILDASANRATEGLRVVEDYARFILDDQHLTTQLKQLRHNLAKTCSDLLGTNRYPARDTQHDVGTTITTASESQRLDTRDVCIASLERTKQSLRSLEEFSKINSPALSSNFESLRYQLYTVEKSLIITAASQSRLDGVSLCVLIDGQKTTDAFATLITQLVDTGVGMIQLRDKTLTDQELLQRARTLTSLTSDLTTPLTIINDRPDIAAASNADGVHLGQDDLSVKDARSILGPQKLIGVSTHNITQARRAVLDGANYLGAGPTFPSTTKTFNEFPGLDFLRELAAEIALPTFAIGGINAENLPQVLDAGITHIAVSKAATSADQILKIINTKKPAKSKIEQT